MIRQFEIYGLERRKLKQDLAELKRFVKNFWYQHQLDKDMAHIYNANTDTYPMKDEKAQELYDNKMKEIKSLEDKLQILFKEEC